MTDPNQWFLDITPSNGEWRDKDYFIENVLFRALIHYWEDVDVGGEGGKLRTVESINIDRFEYGMTVVDHLRHVEYNQGKYDALNAAYRFAKHWVSVQDTPWTIHTPEIDYFEATTHLQSIVEYRGKMWT